MAEGACVSAGGDGARGGFILFFRGEENEAGKEREGRGNERVVVWSCMVRLVAVMA